MILTALTLLMSPGCFTGIESTKAIASKELKQQKSRKPSAEQLIADSIAHEPFALWQPGKTFIVTDSGISAVLTPSADIQVGALLAYKEMRPVLTVMGDSVADIVFTSPASSYLLTYRTGLTPAALRGAQSVFIPFTIETSMVETARRLLLGRKVYILTPLWLTADGLTPRQCRKFVPVTITDVVPGNSTFPLRILFADTDTTQHSIYINADAPTATSRSFDSLFSLTDPRRKYPQIADATWTLITRADVVEGMTTQECRLALGPPDDIDRRQIPGNIYERWTYSGGTSLTFDNGLLTTYRKH